jgi:hypothetical protein
MLRFEKKGILNFSEWLKDNISVVHTYSDFFGIELIEQDKITIKFISLSFFFIGSIILRYSLIGSRAGFYKQDDMGDGVQQNF